jgi:diphosphomevalonate decarboxylase
MKNKADVIQYLLHDKKTSLPTQPVSVFAPSNIALIKYWGKRDAALNLPQTASLSVTIPGKGATTEISILDNKQDEIYLNGMLLSSQHPFFKKAVDYLDLFRPMTRCHYRINTTSNIPIAAGLASSASGFAALVLALDRLHQWQCSLTALSIAARLGSGSACRSLWSGFVLWQSGIAEDGMDSHGIALKEQWPELRLGFTMISDQPKAISSREGMNRTTNTSALYRAWPDKVSQDLQALQQALAQKEFTTFGEIVESNALAMHATMMAAWPPVVYSQPETLEHMQRIWQLREQGIPVYFTQDAGPNLKLLFLVKDEENIRQHFPGLDVVTLF